MTVERALLSVHDKSGLAAFAEGLHAAGVELVASGGTARFLAEAGLPVTAVSELTGFPEMLGHRVVTLHPAVHGGILARRDVPGDLEELVAAGIGRIDLVCVGLYPFERVVAGLDPDEAEAIEMIDVGGPALLRAAAKNHAHVAAVCRPDDYEAVLGEIRATRGVSPELRRRLALRAFATTAAYDGQIAAWLGRDEPFPETLTPVFDRVLELPYGENPHQRGAYYAQRGARTHLLSRVEQLHGKPLSYNNLNDLSAARLACLPFAEPACVIVKHAAPCGVAVGATIEAAYERALAADPVSAYGGVVVCNRAVTAALGERLAGQFVEVLFAPGYDEAGLALLVAKPGVRVLNDLERRAFAPAERDLKRVLGGVLVQDRDVEADPREGLEVVCGSPTEAQWGDLLFAWAVVRHVPSNAIVLARGGATVGIGGGQTSRVDAVRIALGKARAIGHPLEGAVLASDAFFPFADGVEAALERGIAAIVQPGGSKRDDEVLRAVDAAGAAMVFTHRRHFRH
ncbi:MAG TPA: bifunctional phosphoribosylaminoimidazolecarboxamide formyltransferase/IMP cyclohydrolase [Gaiellaceae bacterium]|nr:bifunctional phosphoribosylaminoimidazolecarboxamide formyltransferase/IMP cyclohydrolase [Gaiellaceae bacterium]